jgi:hypothetical protein
MVLFVEKPVKTKTYDKLHKLYSVRLGYTMLFIMSFFYVALLVNVLIAVLA